MSRVIGCRALVDGAWCPLDERRNGLCWFHAAQAEVGVPFSSPPERSGNAGKRRRTPGVYFHLPGEVALVRAIDRDGEYRFGFIDSADVEVLAARCKRWRVDDRGHHWYVRADEGPFKRKRLQNVLLGEPPEGMTWDHLNRNGWDNRRCTLEAKDAKGQAQNRRPPQQPSR